MDPIIGSLIINDSFINQLRAYKREWLDDTYNKGIDPVMIKVTMEYNESDYFSRYYIAGKSNSTFSKKTINRVTDLNISAILYEESQKFNDITDFISFCSSNKEAKLLFIAKMYVSAEQTCFLDRPIELTIE